MVLDLNKNTLKYTPMVWAVVGSATPGDWPASDGHQSDTDMKFNNGTQLWSITVNLIGGKEIKFRRNHNWDVSYGDASPSNGSDLSGSGGNIQVATSGTYNITLDLNDSKHPKYSLVKQ